ncbi:MAG: GntP family permease [Lachnospiraceae bacterium]|jgi:H+/gluconate symporter-like permease
MGYVSIFLGFAILIVLSLSNVSVYIGAVAAALVVIFMNGLPFTETLFSDYFGAFGNIVKIMLPMYLSGAILAKLYTKSGAARVIADKICFVLMKGAKNDRQIYARGMLAVIVSSAILCYGGINAAVAIITIYPIALQIFKTAGIPKRFIMGAICGGAFTFALSGPGSPQPTNVVAMVIGTPAHCGLVAGLVGMLVEIVIMVLLLAKMCAKATASGETFAYGPKDNGYEDNNKGPVFMVALLPLIILLILFNVFSLNISVAAMLACILSAILFSPYLRNGKILDSINEGAVMSLLPAGAIAAVNGFAAVIRLTPEYNNIIDGILGMDISPVLLLILTLAFICSMTGGSTTGTQIALPVLAQPLMNKGLSAVFIHRVGVYASTTLDSLPHSGAIIMAVNVADLKMREAYPAVFVTTVLATTVGTITVALVMKLLPFLP